MPAALLPDNETERLAALHALDILDSGTEPAFDGIARLASLLCATPVALVNLVDKDRLWFKAAVGIDLKETPRAQSLCAYAIANGSMVIVPDTHADARFRELPLVTAKPGVRFYAGAPLVTAAGYALGTLCVADYQPRQLTPAQIDGLELLAQQTVAFLESRLGAVALRTSEQQLRALFDAIPDHVRLRDTAGRYIAINRSQEQDFGLPASEIIGKTNYDFRSPELARRLEAEDQQVMATGTPLRTEVIARHYGNTWREVIKAPIRDTEGTVIGVVAISRDISKRKRAEAALHDSELKQAATLAASEAKSQFLAYLSHEIRAPMNGILGLTQVALMKCADDAQRDLLQQIDVAGQSLMEIVNDTLDLSKIEAGKLEIEHQPFDLAVALEAVRVITDVAAQAKGLALTLVMDEAVPVALIGDALRVRQILTNLIGNAVKFTDAGSVAVRVSLLELHAAAHRVHVNFAIIDSGIGISTEHQSRLFQPFTQADSSITRRYGGTGLGLAICKRLVESMGGAIGVESKPRNGSRFYFDLWLETAPPA